MKHEVLENYGVRVTRTRRGVRYSLPWRRHLGMKGKGWVRAAVAAVLPCVMAMCLPVGVMHFFLPRASPAEVAGFWIVSTVWWLMMRFFVCLFGAMAASMATGWGRGWIWVNSTRIVAWQLMGEDSLPRWIRLGVIVEFATLCDAGERENPAASGRLLACTRNDATRLMADYPVELLVALKEELGAACGKESGKK